jgi:transposase-like protein
MHDLCRAGGSRGLDIHVSHSKHQCSSCKRCFNANMNDLAPPKSQYTHRVRLEAIRLVLGSGLSYRSASKRLRRDFHVLVPFATIHNWVEEVIHAGPPVAGEPVQATPQGKQEKQ